MPKTMYEKIWNDHVVRASEGDTAIIYVDRHLIHEVTSPQAFAGLRETGRKVHMPQKTFATMDHNVSTRTQNIALVETTSRHQMQTLSQNCKDFGVTLYDFGTPDQGIVHVIGPEKGITQPGMVIVCGDSHTSTHGAFGALAFGIGTSEVEHVLATQTLQQNKAKTMLIQVDGTLQKGVTPKDIILAIIGCRLKLKKAHPKTATLNMIAAIIPRLFLPVRAFGGGHQTRRRRFAPRGRSLARLW